jgi:hypothetical protein
VSPMLYEGLLTVLDVPNKFHRKKRSAHAGGAIASARFPSRGAQRVWDCLSRRGRLDALYDLAGLLPLLPRSCPGSAVVHRVEAVQDVARWWN